MTQARAILLAAVFLFAQFGAQAHAYTHLSNPRETQHHAHPAPCASCSAFAPLLAAAGHAALSGLVVLMRPALQTPQFCPAPASTGRHSAYRSRAPPNPLPLV